MSQQTVCDGCGEPIDTSQPYYSGTFQMVQESGGTLISTDGQASALDYHIEHSPIPPSLDSLQPATIGVDDGDVVVHTIGSGFTEDSKIVFGGTELGTAFVSSTDLSCTINGGHGVGEDPILVRRGTLDSNALTFTITA